MRRTTVVFAIMLAVVVLASLTINASVPFRQVVTTIIVEGRNFGRRPSVAFSGIPVEPHTNSDTQLMFGAPPQALSGPAAAHLLEVITGRNNAVTFSVTLGTLAPRSFD
jgi:hypothetical protein